MFKQYLMTGIMLLLVLIPVGSGTFAQTDEAQNPDIPELAAGNTEFAFDLYQQVQQGEESNILFAPYSLSQALAMTYAGANGETAAQIAAVLNFTLDQDQLHAAFRDLNTDLSERGNVTKYSEFAAGSLPPTLNIANGLWGEQTFAFDPAYMEQMVTYYGAGLQLTDFIHAPDAARDTINAWVAENTEDMITNILPPGVIEPTTRLALVNAIYFRDYWLEEFFVGDTFPEDFTLLDGSTVTVAMMHARHQHTSYIGDNYVAVNMPYLDDDTTMILLLPDEGEFEAFEDSLDATKFTEILNSPHPDSPMVVMGMPHFQFDFAVNLSDSLKAMGITTAFDRVHADFSLMATVTSDNNLWISDVVHKAFIGVDEYGTAAGGASIILEGGGGGPTTDLVVNLNRPFIFAIYDQLTQTVLFLGRVMNPLDTGE